MLFTPSNLGALVIVLSVLSLASFVYSYILSKKIKLFLLGADAGTLESAILSDRKTVAGLIVENKSLQQRLDTAERKMSQTVRSVETVRFNPFPDQGSNQSFATALIDETGSGVVLSSLYARERVSIFAKPVLDFKSIYELTIEEKQALEQVKNNQHVK